MKKNKMMRIASFLLIAVLLTTSVISGTFAKYVTSDEVADAARVAKFGVVVTGSGSLFDQTYYTTGNTPGNLEDTHPDYDEGSTTVLSVESSNGDNLVAPGTKNTDGVSVAITGTPEVDVYVDLSAKALEEIFLKAGLEGLPDMTTGKAGDVFGTGSSYYPIEWTLTRVFDNPGGDQDPAKEELKTWDWTLIKERIESFSGEYDANTNLAAAIGTFTLTWEWKFEDNSDEYMFARQDKCDTLLGDLAALVVGELDADADEIATLQGLTKGMGCDYNLNVDIQLTASVTQID